MTQRDTVHLHEWPLLALIEGFTALAVEIVQTPKTLTRERDKIVVDAEAFLAEIERRLHGLDTAARRARAHIAASQGDFLRYFRGTSHLAALEALTDDVIRLFLVEISQHAITAGEHRAPSMP